MHVIDVMAVEHMNLRIYSYQRHITTIYTAYICQTLNPVRVTHSPPEFKRPLAIVAARILGHGPSVAHPWPKLYIRHFRNFTKFSHFDRTVYGPSTLWVVLT
jgi:hypothetical protein